MRRRASAAHWHLSEQASDLRRRDSSIVVPRGMVFDLPNHDALYDALFARDATHDGRACRRLQHRHLLPPDLSRPQAEVGEPHVLSHHRRLQRLPPLAPMAPADPATVRRSFKRHFGMTFLEMARYRRPPNGFDTRAKGCAVIESQLEAGRDIARTFGRPAAVRAVTRATGANGDSQIALVVRRHRSICADGTEGVATGSLSLAAAHGFKDRIAGDAGLHAMPGQSARTAASRDMADSQDISLFICARTHLFLNSVPDAHENLSPEALDRTAA